MLILTRKKGEQIFIGNDIVIEVTDFKSFYNIKQVQLGIAAPKDLKISRGYNNVKNKSDWRWIFPHWW